MKIEEMEEGKAEITMSFEELANFITALRKIETAMAVQRQFLQFWRARNKGLTDE
jgi:hypothetical protein